MYLHYSIISSVSFHPESFRHPKSALGSTYSAPLPPAEAMETTDLSTISTVFPCVYISLQYVAFPDFFFHLAIGT